MNKDTADIEWLDSSDKEPVRDGWYAVHYCWSVREGSFVGADRYSSSWENDYPIIQFAGPFMNKAEAEEWADNNDISF